MPAGYIAQIAGSAPDFSVVQFATAGWASVGQGGWVPVAVSYPVLDNITQIATSPVWTVAADGSSVTLSFNSETLDPIWVRMRLIDFATQQSQALAYGGLTLPNGVELATTDDKIGALKLLYDGIQNGWLTSPFTVQTVSGAFVDLAASDIQAALTALGQFRQTNMDKRKACIAAIQAGTITSSAQVLAAI